jgi:hypothetical protein
MQTAFVRLFSVTCVTLLLLSATGCGVQQVSSPNRRVLAALQTAVAARNSEWLEASAKQISEKKAKGEISQAEFDALEAIIRKAHAKEWAAAQAAALALGDGQRATAEEKERLQKHRR